MTLTLIGYKLSHLKNPVDCWFAEHSTVVSEIHREVESNPRPSPTLIWNYLRDEHQYPYSIDTVERRLKEIVRSKKTKS